VTVHHKALRTILVLLVGLLEGCSVAAPYETPMLAEPSQVSPETAPLPHAASKARADQGVTGVWHGTSTASCPFFVLPGRCAAVQKITLTIFQRGSEITGFYRCATGSVVCLNINETGVIKAARLDGRRLSFRVMMRDGSSCFFTTVPAGEEMRGGYSCYQGGGLLEQGRWDVRRSY
jgi:hypothetical protein